MAQGWSSFNYFRPAWRTRSAEIAWAELPAGRIAAATIAFSPPILERDKWKRDKVSGEKKKTRARRAGKLNLADLFFSPKEFRNFDSQSGLARLRGCRCLTCFFFGKEVRERAGIGLGGRVLRNRSDVLHCFSREYVGWRYSFFSRAVTCESYRYYVFYSLFLFKSTWIFFQISWKKGRFWNEILEKVWLRKEFTTGWWKKPCKILITISRGKLVFNFFLINGYNYNVFYCFCLNVCTWIQSGIMKKGFRIIF